MRRMITIVICLAFGAFLPRSRCQAQDIRPVTPLPSVPPAPRDNPTTRDKVALGARLFFDPRLSGNNSISCATCHDPALAYADGKALSQGWDGKPLARNTPGCLNVAFWNALFWDGRANSLEEQAVGPLTSQAEMNQDPKQLEQELDAIAAYRSDFQRIFGSKPTLQTITQALAAFQRTLITKPSPFDRFLAGDKHAISADARRGWELFRGDAGCIECHHGPLLSDQKFHRIGVSFQDEGRAKITGRPEDAYRFRTPSLRNVADTAPYMHDGSLPSLDSVVMFYFRNVPDSGPHGIELDTSAKIDQSISDIPLLVAFLKSLSGEYPRVTPPLLPELLPGEPDTLVAPASHGEGNSLVHRVRTPYQSGTTYVRVLLPDAPPSKPLPLVLVLPVEKQGESRYGNGLDEIRRQGLHNRYPAVYAEPSFSSLPWYADHPTDPAIRQESYLLKVVIPVIERFYRVSDRPADRHLLGFSKSGWGAWAMLLRHPNRFGKAVAWDAPLMMQSIGKYGNRPIFGDQRTFEKYKVARLLREHAATFHAADRFLLYGYGNFRTEHTDMHALLDQLKVSHAYWDGPQRKHDWHSGWVAPAVDWLLGSGKGEVGNGR